MTASGYYYRLAKERKNNRGQIPRATTYWHVDPICSWIPRGAYAVGPVPVEIDLNDPNVLACACFDESAVYDDNIRVARQRAKQRGLG